MQSLHVAFLVLVTAAFARAQQPRDRGPTIAVPLMLITAPGSPDPAGGGTASPRQVYSKRAGFQALGNHAPTAARPDFSFAAIFSGANIGVDAMSIGLDQIHADCSGVIDYTGCSCWSALLFSVEDGTGASTSSGAVAREHASVDGAGADVFSYVPQQSNVLAAFYRGHTERALDSTELGLFRGGATPVKGQIDSLDAYMSLYELDDDVFAQLSPDPTVYFSVTNGTRSAVPSSWWYGSTPSGATILRRQWNPTTRRWETRPPLYTHSALGLPAMGDIDGLAVDKVRQNVVFSMTRSTTPSGLSQLIFVSNCTDTVTLVDYSESTPTGTTRVADGTGSGSGGEVRGVCEWDPSVVQVSPGGVGLMAFIGSSLQPALVPSHTSLDIATYRSRDAAGNVTYSAHLTGLPPGTGTSVAHFLLALPDFAAPFSPLFVVGGRPIVVRGGDPVSQQITVPVVSLVGYQMLGVWVAIGSGGVAFSNPALMYL